VTGAEGFMKKCLLVISVVAGLSPAGYALQSGANFLKIDTAARAVSMGSAYTALAAGADSLAYNTAGLASAAGPELGFSHTNWLMGSRHDFICMAAPLGKAAPAIKNGPLVLGFGYTRLSNGGFDARNADRSGGGGFTAYDQAAMLGIAGGVGKYRLGIGVKYIESVIAGEKARAVAADLGLNRTLGVLPVMLGVSVQNLGAPMKFISQKDPLPLTIAAGGAVPVIPGLNLAVDVKHLIYDRQNRVSVGMEYGVLSSFALRSGYLMNSAVRNNASGGSRGFSVGAGLNFWSTQLDYSVTPYGDLGDTQKITLKKQF
jgi:hypothetical protein